MNVMIESHRTECRDEEIPASPDRLSRVPSTLYIFDNLLNIPTSHIDAALVRTSPLDMRLFLSRQTLVTLSARDHRFGTRHNWPVGPGRKPTSRAASKRVAACRPSSSFVAINRAASDGWRICARVGRVASCPCRPSAAARTALSDRWTGWFLSFEKTSGTRAKSPSSCPVIPGSNGFGFFCRPIVRHWMAPEGDRQLRCSLRGSAGLAKSGRRDGGALSGTNDRGALLTHIRELSRPRPRRCP